jgi:prevent-host-death family protein
MVTSGQLKTITDFRNSVGMLLDQVKKVSQPIGILRRNRLEAYLIGAKTFENLEQLAEDVLDRQIVASRFRNAKKTDFVPYRQ